jgi:hypothetical protein
MKIWSTKWVLTDGVVELEGEVCADVSANMVEVKHPQSGRTFFLHGEGKEWHRTEESAIQRALTVAERKLVAIERQAKSIKAKQDAWKLRRDQLAISLMKAMSISPEEWHRGSWTF